MWYLVIVLLLADGTSNIEQHVAIEMPDEATCEILRERFVYATQILYMEADDERIPLKINEKICMEADDSERLLSRLVSSQELANRDIFIEVQLSWYTL